MKINNFLAELKRRNVIRMAGLYLVGAWLLTQVASTVLPMFGTPDWLPRSIVILLVIGFVPALIFSWVFELTPQGLKRDEDVPPEESTAAYQVAEVYGYRNDKDHAFEWLERARRQRDAGLPALGADTLLTNLHDDARWDAFLHTMGLADDQLK
jgi:hypothetical protein